MNFYNKERDGRSGGRNFGGSRPSFGRSQDDRPMFSATCSDCGNTCRVPFRPTGERPVYCSECFKRGDEGNQKPSFRPQRGGSYHSPSSPDAHQKPSASEGSKKDFDLLNTKLDKILSLLKSVSGTSPESDPSPKKEKAKTGETTPEVTPTKTESKKTQKKAAKKKSKKSTDEETV